MVNFVPFVGIIEIWKLKKFQLLTPSGHEISLFEIWAKYIVTKICHFEFWLSLITSGLSKGPIKLKKLLSCLVSTMIFIKRRKKTILSFLYASLNKSTYCRLHIETWNFLGCYRYIFALLYKTKAVISASEIKFQLNCTNLYILKYASS